MELSRTLRSSHKLYLAAARPPQLQTQLFPLRFSPRRHASSSKPPSKPIVLEEPDKFRPPSHPSRLVRSRPGRGGAYNQSSTLQEKQTQQTKQYPHTFPNEGTFLHWFLTNRSLHLWITLGVLTVLATTSILQSFTHTSPYAYLLPPWTSIFLHPITYVSECWAVFKLHTDYNTDIAARSRAQAILDTQYRRIYRRAHGMEDLELQEDQGVDVRGLVPWDDGLTNPERERGGRRLTLVTGKEMMDEGLPGETLEEFAKRKRKRERQEKKAAAAAALAAEEEEDGERERLAQQDQAGKRKRKLWLGIW